MFSTDGVHLASGSWDNTIKIWVVETKAQLSTLTEHTNWVYSVAFSTDSIYLASGSRDKKVGLWKMKQGSLDSPSMLTGHTPSVESVAFSPDSKTVASGSGDFSVRLWDVASGAHITTLSGHSDWVYSVSFSPTGKCIASGSYDNTVRIWRLADGGNYYPSEVCYHSEPVFSVAFSPDGERFATGSDERTVWVWDVASGTLVHALQVEGKRDRVFSVAFSPNGTRIASGAGDRTVCWDLVPSEASGSSDGFLPYHQMNEGDVPDETVTFTPSSNDITGSVTLVHTTRLALGGFGDLFLGNHQTDGKVALKRPHTLFNETTIRRFLREVDLWCSVSHRYILPCLGVCKIDSDVYVVSPFIENGDLLSCMTKGKTLNRIKLIYEVAEALTHLHHRGIVHGDVKAQNILLSDDGSALLCDFGLAKAFDTMATSTDVKGAGSVRWMAPELFMGDGRSMASDVYSLGLTIAEILSGHVPYHHITETLAVLHHVVYNDGRPLKEPINGPEGQSYGILWETAEKCWAKDVKARPYMAQVLGMLFPLTRELA